MKKLTKELTKSLVSDFGELTADFFEVGIDALMENDIVKEIPILGSVYKLSKIGLAIKEKHMLKKLYKFLYELNTGEIDKEKLKKYQCKLNNNVKYAEEELERIIVILDSYTNVEKSEILAKLYKAYINERISWEEFNEFSEINNRMFLEDIPVLWAVWTGNYSSTKNSRNVFRTERLNSLGLIAFSMQAMNKSRMDYYLELSSLGSSYSGILFNHNDNKR